MGIITLTSDLGLKDHYVATLKGAIYSSCPDVSIVDISHHVKSFSIIEAAYYLNGSYKDFPDGTVHVIGVQSEPVLEKDNVTSYLPSILKFDNQYFVANNNGIFGLLLKGRQPQGFWNIEDILSDVKNMKDATKFMLIPAACNIIKNSDFDSFTTPATRIMNALSARSTIAENSILGQVIHVDNYGNLITNIEKGDFYRFGESTPFIIKLKHTNSYQINVISESYGDVNPGDLVAFFNLDNLLEVGINQGASGNGNGANKLLGIHLEDEVYIDFSPRGSKTTLDSLF